MDKINRKTHVSHFLDYQTQLSYYTYFLPQKFKLLRSQSLADILRVFPCVTASCGLLEQRAWFVLLRLQRNSANPYLTVEYAVGRFVITLIKKLLCIDGAFPNRKHFLAEHEIHFFPFFSIVNKISKISVTLSPITWERLDETSRNFDNAVQVTKNLN